MNTKPITISFYGLCGIKHCTGVTHVFLHPGHGDAGHEHGTPAVGTHAHGGSTSGRHDPTMSANLKFVHVEDERFWQPDIVVTTPGGTQVGVWRIPAGTRAEAVGPCGNKPHCVDPLALGTYHNATQTLDYEEAMKAICGLSAFSLQGGQFSADRPRKVLVTVPVDGPTPKEAKVATRRSWQAASEAPVVLTSAGRVIPIDPGGELTVSNVARVLDPYGLAHVSHYYDFLHPYIPTKNRIRLSSAVVPAQNEEARTMEETVYDCVPPADLP